MFNNILIVEDQASIAQGIKSELAQLPIKKIDVANYCDDAFLKIKASKLKQPIELLITDLSFKENHRQRKITSGQELIKKSKTVLPNLKVIVFTIENRLWKINELIDDIEVDGFIEKSREESKEIIKAVINIYHQKKYYSESIKSILTKRKGILAIDEHDTLLLQLISKGMHQEKIVDEFKRKKIPSASKRSIEYRLNRIKTIFDAKNLPHLIAVAKDNGLI